MLRRLPHKELHEAWYSRLDSDAATSSYDVYPASGVPLGATFPYVTLQLLPAVQNDSKDTVLNEIRGIAKAHTRTAVGKGDDGDVYDMMNNISQATTRTQISTSNGQSTIYAKPQTGTPIAYENDGYMHRDGEVEVRFLIQDKGA